MMTHGNALVNQVTIGRAQLQAPSISGSQTRRWHDCCRSCLELLGVTSTSKRKADPSPHRRLFLLHACTGSLSNRTCPVSLCSSLRQRLSAFEKTIVLLCVYASRQLRVKPSVN
jgi:hypothetical protein